MIKSFNHKGLRKFFESGSVAGIQPKHAKRLKMQLVALDTATTLDDMNIPGFKLHPLGGDEKNRWSIWVNGALQATIGLNVLETMNRSANEQTWLPLNMN